MDDLLDTVTYDSSDVDTHTEQERNTGPNLTASLLADPAKSKNELNVQASLSDVIFSHSLTLTDQGDNGEVDADEKETFNIEFDDIIMGGGNPPENSAPENGHEEPVNFQVDITQSTDDQPQISGPSLLQLVSSIPDATPQQETNEEVQPNPATESSVSETGPSAVPATEPSTVAESHIPAESSTAGPDDFEDAVDPAQISSLKAAEHDSDDEFDFDLPGSKSVGKKTVTFSGVGLSDSGDAKNVEKPQGVHKGEEIAGQNATVTTAAAETVAGMIVKEAAVSNFDAAANAAASTFETAAAVPSVSAKNTPNTTVKTGAGIAHALPEAASSGPNIVQQANIASTVQGEVPAIPVTVKQEDKVESEEEVKEHDHIIRSSAEDWDNVETVEAGFVDPQAAEGGESMVMASPLLSFSEIWQHFRGLDHSQVKDKIQTSVERRGFSAFVRLLFGPPKLHRDLQAERELVFCIAATALDNQDNFHTQSLQTIYRNLTGSRFNCQRFGSHWEEVGFQGRDPATDLRGTGMLALTQLLYFLQEPTTAQLARDLYKLSLHPTQNFPFCVMCINISRICLQSLREDILNKECNRQRAVVSVVNQFYAGALLHLYRLWKQGKTISDSGFVIKEVETRSKKSSKDVFKDLQAYIASQKLTTDATGDEDVNFFSVVKPDKGKSAAELY